MHPEARACHHYVHLVNFVPKLRKASSEESADGPKTANISTVESLTDAAQEERGDGNGDKQPKIGLLNLPR